MNKDIEKIKDKIKEYITLKKYVFFMGACSLLSMFIGLYMMGFVLICFSILGLILLEKYKMELQL